MIRMLLTLCMCMLAVLLIWGDGTGLESKATATATPAESSRQIPALQAVAYTPTEPTSALPLVLPLVTTPAPMAQVSAPETAMDLRYVTAQTVNVREGPSTEFPVIGKLTRGEATRLLWLEDNGWAHIILEGDGLTGFVSGDFLSADAP